MVSSIENNWIFIFDPLMGLKQVLLLRIRVDLGVMEMKRYFTFPQASPLDDSVSYPEH